MGAPVAVRATNSAPRLTTRRVRRGAGAPGVVQLVSLELAAGGVLAAFWAAPLPVLAAVGVAALVLLAAVFGRADGRWWYEGVGARWRLRQRRAAGRTAAVPAMDPRVAALSALSTLAPRLAIRSVADRGRSLGVGQDEEGWYAGVTLGHWSDLSGGRPVRMDVDLLGRVLDESLVPISSLQLVTHQTVAPTALLDKNSAAVRSHQELAGATGCPVAQDVWVAVRLNPPDALEAAASRGGGLDGVDRALAAAVGRIEKALTAAALPYQVLDADGLRDALTRSCGLETLARGGTVPDAAARERWVAWHAAGLIHVTFTVTGWPREPDRDLLTQLTSVPGAAVSAAVTVRTHGDRVALLGLVRVVAPPDRLRASVKSLNATAHRLGVSLRRMDGEQARGVYATAPTGGGGW